SLIDVAAGSVPGMTTLPHLHELAVTGPAHVDGVSDTPSRRKIFLCRPAQGEDEVPCATRDISTLARQAYRRPVTDRALQGLHGTRSAPHAGRAHGGRPAHCRPYRQFRASVAASAESQDSKSGPVLLSGFR